MEGGGGLHDGIGISVGRPPQCEGGGRLLSYSIQVLGDFSFFFLLSYVYIYLCVCYYVCMYVRMYVGAGGAVREPGVSLGPGLL